MLETIETRFAVAADRAFRHALMPPAFEIPARLRARKEQVPFHAPEGQAANPKAVAFVNHGRWLVECPFCPSYQYASLDGLFYCAICLNKAAGHRTVPLKLPVNAGEITNKLMDRPLPEHRNWLPGETVKDLARQDEQAIREGRHLVG